MQDKQIKQHIQKVRQTIEKAIHEFDLIQENDRILVGVSGGMDSMTMLEALSVRKKHTPYPYTLIACHIDIENIPYEIDQNEMQEFCDQIDVPFVYRKILFQHKNQHDQSICFTCSLHRRKELFRICEEYQCNKLCLGHIIDDNIETLLLNMAFNGAISAIPPKLSMFGNTLSLIRPMISLFKKDINTYALMRQFKPEKTLCPHKFETKRTTIRNIIDELEKLNPPVRQNLNHAMRHIYLDFLPPQKKR